MLHTQTVVETFEYDPKNPERLIKKTTTTATEESDPTPPIPPLDPGAYRRLVRGGQIGDYSGYPWPNNVFPLFPQQYPVISSLDTTKKADTAS